VYFDTNMHGMDKFKIVNYRVHKSLPMDFVENQIYVALKLPFFYLKPNLRLSFHILPGFMNCLFTSDFPTKSLCVFVSSGLPSMNIPRPYPHPSTLYLHTKYGKCYKYDTSLYFVFFTLLSLSPYWYFRGLALKIPQFTFLRNGCCVQQLNAKLNPENVTILNEDDQRSLATFQYVT